MELFSKVDKNHFSGMVSTKLRHHLSCVTPIAHATLTPLHLHTAYLNLMRFGKVSLLNKNVSYILFSLFSYEITNREFFLTLSYTAGFAIFFHIILCIYLVFIGQVLCKSKRTSSNLNM